MTGRTLYFRLLKHVYPYRGRFLLAIFGMVLFAATEPALPALMQPMLDGSFIEKDETMIVLIPILLVLLYLVRSIARFISTVALHWVSNKVVMDLRALMFDRLLTLPISYYDRQPAGTTISKLTYDVSQVANAATDVLIILVRDSLTVLGLLGWMLYVDWKLSLIVFLIVPVIISVVRIVSKKLRGLNHTVQDAMGGTTQIAEEAIFGHRVVKIFGGELYETRRFHDAINRVRQYIMKTVVVGAINSSVVHMVTITALAVLVYIASVKSSQNELTVGQFISFFGAMAMLIAPVKRLTSLNEQLQRGLAAADSVFALMDEKPESNPKQPVTLPTVGEVAFKNLTFRYHEQDDPALKGINLTVHHNETIALVGTSGSGKSTLVNLLPLFYAPTSGSIEIDGTNIRDISLQELRQHIALVSQDVVLFNDTVAANIAYGALADATPEKIRDAASHAHALEFIEQLPNGFDTMIGDKGTRLSGGQRQRLAIARALLKNAPILILDEATSALDSHAERYIQEALDELVKDRTTLMIAHRLSTIAHADRILVLENGEIIEEGDHATLYAQGGKYTHLYDTQFQER